MYDLSSGEWTLYLRLIGVVEQAVMEFSKHSHMASNNLHDLIIVYGSYASVLVGWALKHKMFVVFLSLLA